MFVGKPEHRGDAGERGRQFPVDRMGRMTSSQARSDASSKPMPCSSASSASIASQWAASAARFSAISANTGSGLLCLDMVTATRTLGAVSVAAARVPALTTLAPAAAARNLRRVGSRGGNIMGWSIADVFVGGVIYTLSAWAMGFDSLMVRVRAGAEVSASPRLAILVNLFDGQVN
jgi:hypothetical protein